jgi:3-hydroxyacyl-CoA dehydrogenase
MLLHEGAESLLSIHARIIVHAQLVSAGLQIRAREFSMSSPVRYDVVDRVALITIDNPPVNALSAAVWDAIDQAVGRAAIDSSVDAAVLIPSSDRLTPMRC